MSQKPHELSNTMQSTDSDLLPGETTGTPTLVDRLREVRHGLMRLCQHRAGLAGALIVGLCIFLALFGEMLAPYSYTAQNPYAALQPPSAQYWFGTDQFGRDIFSRVIVGSRDIIVLSFSATVLGLFLGVSVSLVAGYYGGWTDDWLMRAMDVLLAFPTLLLALLILSTLGSELINLIIGIGVVTTPYIARVVRSEVLVVREQEFVDAARLRGESDASIMLHEILPNVSGPIIVEGSLKVSHAILLGSALSFLGLGVQPPAPDWGLQVSDGRHLILIAPWIMLFPSLAMAVLVIGVNLLADGLRAVLERSDLPVQQVRKPEPSLVNPPPASIGTSTPMPVLRIQHLQVAYRQRGTWINVVHGVSFDIQRGETFGLVGESGCGKSTIALATMQYLGYNGRITGGHIFVQGQNTGTMTKRDLRSLRGQRIGLVYQNPQAALNPSLRVDMQIMEVVRLHERVDERTARQRALAILEQVHMPDPEAIMQRYPHQLSGGQQQRVVIAMALVTNPDVLIMDEPTTGLDETTAAAVLDLVSELKRTFDAAILYISHDLSVVARVCDRVGVMYAGKMVESGRTQDVFHQPHHPYTADLLTCVPGLDKHYRQSRLRTIEGRVPLPSNLPSGCAYHPRCQFARERCQQEPPSLVGTSSNNHHQTRCFFGSEVVQHFSASTPLSVTVPALHQPDQQPGSPQQPMLTLTDLRKEYRQQRTGLFGRQSPPIQAVSNASLTIYRGETFSLVGESGCGKTTLGRCLVGLVTPSAGTIVFRDHDATLPAARRSARFRQAMQMVFQQPETTLNPRHTVGLMLERTLQRLGVHSHGERQKRIVDLLAAVRLDTSYARRYPAQLSGGEKQRVAIARAFAGKPDIVICDEAVSALDVSVQAAILNLLVDLKHEHQCAYLFVSHDLGVVRYLSDRIGVMYLGQVMEIGPAAQVFAAPSHPYTEALLSAKATPYTNGQGAAIRLDGPLPNPAHPPVGCPFHTRCPRKMGAICEQEPPPWQRGSEGHLIRCHIPLDELQTPLLGHP